MDLFSGLAQMIWGQEGEPTPYLFNIQMMFSRLLSCQRCTWHELNPCRLAVVHGNIQRCWGLSSMWEFTVTEQDSLFMKLMANPDQKKVGASNNQFAPSSELPIYPAVKVAVNPRGCFWPSLIMPHGTYMLRKLNHNSHRFMGKLLKQTLFSLSSGSLYTNRAETSWKFNSLYGTSL